MFLVYNLIRISQLMADSQPFTSDFPHANIYDMISPDILHQVIKGVFKDHLVKWVCEYLHQEHGETRANAILDDIDRRIAAAPPFPGLRRFPQGRRFKQWTGDDSKALMKVRSVTIHAFMCDRLFSHWKRDAGISPCDRGLRPRRDRNVHCGFP